MNLEKSDFLKSKFRHKGVKICQLRGNIKFLEASKDIKNEIKIWKNKRISKRVPPPEVPVIILQENAAEKPLEIYSFSLMEKEICRKVDEHEIIDLTVEEDTKLKADAEDLLQGLKTKIQPARDLPDDFHFSLVKDM